MMSWNYGSLQVPPNLNILQDNVSCHDDLIIIDNKSIWQDKLSRDVVTSDGTQNFPYEMMCVTKIKTEETIQ